MAKKGGFAAGWGCALAIVGDLVMAAGLIFALAMYNADEEAAEQNKADWEVYNKEQVKIDAQVDSLTAVYGEEIPDSLYPENPIPTPFIRQGGFATVFGVLGAIVCIIFGSIPLIIGLVLWVKYHNKPRELPKYEEFVRKQEM